MAMRPIEAIALFDTSESTSVTYWRGWCGVWDVERIVEEEIRYPECRW
jgi:hypothetical protein